MAKRLVRPLLALVFIGLFATPVWAQHRVTTPEEQFGFQIGADYQLLNYDQLHEYFIKLANESDRMILDTIGYTEEGRPQVQAIISSPENLRNLDHYKEISRRLARAEGVDSAEAVRLSQEGKAVIWIDGGLHATEVLHAQGLIELVYRMNDYTDPETMRILDDVILLATHVNPDGQQLVANWYMREPDPLKRRNANVPVLYNKYAGHDDNRDLYMSALEESTNINRSLYRDWYPQIIYNHHQTGPAGAVMFAPPFRDPPNQYLDPLILMGLDQVGSAMHQRFVVEGKGGTTMRSGANYSTWWNGGLRTTPYFHNMIGLLTETIGDPTPISVPFVPKMQYPHGDLPLPVEPTSIWHFRQSIEYSMTANWAVLDYASRNRDHLLYNIWRMAENSIQRGSQDSWTVMPDQIAAAEKEIPRAGDHDDFVRLMRDPAKREARGFILPSDQKDFLTATKFINTLMKNGVDVLSATSDFEVAGKKYPAGSWVVKTAQAFRPHILDMFERQDYPNDFAYPGGPPIPPYDAAGYTLAWQMGVQYDRILDAFDGPFQKVTTDLASPPAGKVAGAQNAKGYLTDHINDAFIAVNRVLKSGGKASWYTNAVSAGGQSFEPGAFYLETDRATVEKLAKEKGLNFVGVASKPAGQTMPLQPVKIGLWDRYGGSMPSGWTRMILEDFEFDFDVLFPPDLDTKDLSKYDVLLFEDGAIPASDGAGRGRGFGSPPDPADIPEPYRDRLGNVTVATTVPKILDYVRKGGAVIAIGSSTDIGYLAGLPIENKLMENGHELTGEEYYIPGSILEMKVEHSSPITMGLSDHADVMFDHSPVFSLKPGAEQQGVKKLAWFDSPTPLRSGWAWGQEHLDGGVTAIEADLGKGKLFLFTPLITFRSQPHGVFPLLFNGIYYGGADKRPIS